MKKTTIYRIFFTGLLLALSALALFFGAVLLLAGTREPRAALAADQAPGPADFEARLKQFMQASDSKLSDLKLEKKSSRRGRK